MALAAVLLIAMVIGRITAVSDLGDHFLVRRGFAHTRIGDLRGYVAFEQQTPDCAAYAPR
jgi:hypothetical protein